MGAAQTAIQAFGQTIAFAGMVTRRVDSQSAMNEEATNAISFGIGVKPGAKIKGCLLPTATSSLLKGIMVQGQDYAPGSFGDITQTATPTGVSPKVFGELLTEGRCWVVVDAGSSPAVNTRAYWRAVSDGGSNTVVGTFCTADDGNVVDTRKEVVFLSGKYTAADGVTTIAEVYVSISNAP